MKPIIDISHHQDPDKINYDLLAGEVSGVLLRIAYGSRADTAVEKHYSEFLSRNVPIGFYQFITEYMPVQEQINRLKSALAGKLYPMGLWADIELEAGATPLRKQTVHEYIRLVELQVAPIEGIYTSKYCWSVIMGGAYYTSKKLWVAAYGYNVPPLPTGWTDYWLWQHTSSNRLPGYSGNLDTNRFRYGKTEFQNWLSGEEQPAPIAPTAPLSKLYKPCPQWCYVSQTFGANPGWYPTSKGHNGIDYGFNYQVGHPIYAAADGVVEVSRDDKTGYGRHIRIRHSHGVTIYGHLLQRHVQVGAFVKAKQIIGLNGGLPSDPYAGFSTGAHLHFEYRLDIPAPQVPGGYVYNAIDTLPITVDHEEWSQGDPMLYKIKVIIYALNVRSGVGTQFPVLRTVKAGTIFDVYEEVNGWLRVGVNEWVMGLPTYVEKIPGSEKDRRIDILWEAHPELHE